MNRFISKNNGVYVVNDKGKKTKISRFLKLEKIIKDIDENIMKGVIKYDALGEVNELILGREEYLNKNKLTLYQMNGLDVTQENINLIIEYLRGCEDKISIENVHSKIGFMRFKDKEIYKLYNAIGLNSEYKGSCDIKPVGSYNTYIELLKTEVLGKVELEFALICGLSAILLGFIGEELNLDSLIIHLVGNSTTGKSTALKLAISPFGNPIVNKNSLYGSYNGTNNALLTKLIGLKGVPYALDELSLSGNDNFTQFIYQLANGVDKERLNKESSLKERGTWLTTIISNGEKSLVKSANKNAGLQVRVIELSNFIWTKDADNAEKINQKISENNGQLALKFAEYIIGIGKENLINEYKKIKEETYERMEKNILVDTMSRRRSSKYAILVQTAHLLKDFLNLKINIEGIFEILYEVEKESIKNRNFNKSAIDYIKDYVNVYRSKFGEGNILSSEQLGKIYYLENCIEIEMDKMSFSKIIKEGGFEDEKIVLKELKKGGFLNCEKDRYTRKRNNHLGIKSDFIVIKLQK